MLPSIMSWAPASSYASLLIQLGESLAYVKEQLGHGPIAVTVDVYGISCRAEIGTP